MLLLTTITDFLEVQTANAQVVHWTCSYVDLTSSSFTPNSAEGAVSAAQSTTVAAAPASHTQRQIKFLSVVNEGNAPQTIIIDKNSNGTAYNITGSVILQPGEALNYVDGVGFQVFTILGELKTTATTGPQGNQGNQGTQGVIGSTGPAGSWTQPEVNLGTDTNNDASFVIVDPNILISSNVVVLPSGEVPSSGSIDDYQWDAAIFAASVSIAGQAKVQANFLPGPVTGVRKILYQVN